MKDVLKTPDPVKLSFAQHVLEEAGIECVVFDTATSSMYGGGFSSIQPRLAVAAEDEHQARGLLVRAFKEADGQEPDLGLK